MAHYPLNQDLCRGPQHFPPHDPTMPRPFIPHPHDIPQQYSPVSHYQERNMPHVSHGNSSISWPNPEQLPHAPFCANSTQLPVANATYHQYEKHMQYPSHPNGSGQGYIDQVNMNRPAAQDMWGSMMSDQVKIESIDMQPSSSSSTSFSPQTTAFSPAATSYRSQSGSMLPTFDLGRPQDLSGSPTPSELPSPKEKPPPASKHREPNSRVRGRGSSTGKPVTPSKTKSSVKASHSVVERKYRENLNSRITELDALLTSTRQPRAMIPPTDKVAVLKTRKADVLNEAMRYVKQAEINEKQKADEIAFLKLRVVALEKLVAYGDRSLSEQHFGQQQSGETLY